MIIQYRSRLSTAISIVLVNTFHLCFRMKKRKRICADVHAANLWNLLPHAINAVGTALIAHCKILWLVFLQLELLYLIYFQQFSRPCLSVNCTDDGSNNNWLLLFHGYKNTAAAAAGGGFLFTSIKIVSFLITPFVRN